MYFLALIVTALVTLSIFSSNWPLKWYHFYLLKQLAAEFGVAPVRHGMVLSASYAEIRPVILGREFVIRFMEGAPGSLRNASGLEIRMRGAFPAIMEFYRAPHSKREWGDFKKFGTGDAGLDGQWLILSPQPEAAQSFWDRGKLQVILNGDHPLDQILLTSEEMILRLRRFGSVAQVREVAGRMTEIG
jgi:hypothetical protein